MFATFVVFALTAIVWSLALLRWIFSRRRSARTALVAASCAVALAAASSLISDLYLRHVVQTAHESRVEVRLTRRGDWWQLDYSRPGAAFTTANELHVPAGYVVHLTWPRADARWIDVRNAVSVPRGDHESVLIVKRPSETGARFVALWPPMWRAGVRVVAEPPEQFDSWFVNQWRAARLAAGSGPFLFVNSGCGYCHVIRGVCTTAVQAAPDLTHFASRRTIAGTSIPISRGALTGWVVHSSGLKPGSMMPDNPIDPRTLHPLISYLETLR